MGIWWAAGFSTAAIRIIDDDARGRRRYELTDTFSSASAVCFFEKHTHTPLHLPFKACQWMVEMFKSTSLFASFGQRGVCSLSQQHGWFQLFYSCSTKSSMGAGCTMALLWRILSVALGSSSGLVPLDRYVFALFLMVFRHHLSICAQYHPPVHCHGLDEGLLHMRRN